MAFDKKNPVHLGVLKAEVRDDPLNIGYHPIENVNPLLDKLNVSTFNPGGETGPQKLTAEVLLKISSLPGDLNSAGSRAVFDAVMVRSSFNIERDLEPYRETFKAVFGENSSTWGAINTLTKPLSRAEVLFGVETKITKQDWAAARDYNG